MERVADDASDDNDSPYTVEGDYEEEEQDITIDDDVYFSSDEDCAHYETMHNSFATLTNKFMPIWKTSQSKMFHDCTQVGWKFSSNPIIIVDEKELLTSEDADAVKFLLFKLTLSNFGLRRT